MSEKETKQQRHCLKWKVLPHFVLFFFVLFFFFFNFVFFSHSSFAGQCQLIKQARCGGYENEVARDMAKCWDEEGEEEVAVLSRCVAGPLGSSARSSFFQSFRSQETKNR